MKKDGKVASDQAGHRKTVALKKTVVIAVVLAALAFMPFAQTWQHEFVAYDDPDFLTENEMVRKGLTVEGMWWAFTSFHAANWLPLTWLSHMLDVSLFGMDPGWHHLVSAVIHALSAALLFLALFRMTGAVWRSAFVAALFGVHPLHVESVAWAAQRRDVLAGLFFMLLLLAYERYARRGGARRYLLVAVLFALGLLSKQTLVTVPFVLLLLDVWPLGRTSLAAAADGSPVMSIPWQRLVLEKLPFLAFTLAASVVAFQAQRSGGAMFMMEREVVPLAVRVANAVVSYAAYLGNAAWPASLAVLYPHPGWMLPVWKVAAAALFLAAVTVMVFLQRRERTYLAVGWLWYLGMLFPLIGLVQIGVQAMADRYTYLPLIGPFLMVAWYAGDAGPSSARLQARLPAVLSGLAILLCLIASVVQASAWKDTVTLFRHAAEASPDNWMAHRKLGNALADRGLAEEAMEQYRESLRVQPRNPFAHNNLAVELARLGRFDEAIGHYREAIGSRPSFAEAHNNLGNALAAVGRRDEAVQAYRQAMDLRPGWMVPQRNLELLLAQKATPGAAAGIKAGQAR